MENKEHEKQRARLEFVNDQLQAEIEELDSLFRAVGFPHGIASAKAVAAELLKQEPV